MLAAGLSQSRVCPCDWWLISSHLLFRVLPGDPSVSVRSGLAKGDGWGPSADRAAGRTDGQAHARGFPGLRRCERDQLRILSRLQDRFLKILLGIRIGIFLGIVLLMAAKPGLWESIGIVGSSVVVGLLSPLLAWRRSGALSAPSIGFANQRDEAMIQESTTSSNSVHVKGAQNGKSVPTRKEQHGGRSH
jgi:hypothetical protein